MKKKEREHLKEDPFANFIQSVLEKFHDLKREIFIIGGVIIIVAVIVVAFVLLRSGSVTKDNINLANAMKIWDSETLTPDQKIEELSAIKRKKGLSSVIHFYLASLYYEKGEFQKAKDELAKYDSSNKLLDDQKKLLEAEILLAMDNGKEGLDILHRILSDTRSEISRDFLLLRIAKVYIKDGITDSARENLNRLTNEFPQSIYQQEARELLNEIKN